MLEMGLNLNILQLFFWVDIVLMSISTTSSLWSTGKTRKYQQIDVYIYQCEDVKDYVICYVICFVICWGIWSINPFKPNRFSRSYLLAQTMSILRVVEWYYHFHSILLEHSVSEQWSHILLHLIWVCAVCLCPTKRTLGWIRLRAMDDVVFVEWAECTFEDSRTIHIKGSHQLSDNFWGAFTVFLKCSFFDICLR